MMVYYSNYQKEKQLRELVFFVLASLVLLLILYSFFILRYKVFVEPTKFQSYYRQQMTLPQVIFFSKKLINEHQEITRIKISWLSFLTSLKIKIFLANFVAKICYQQKCFLLDKYGRLGQLKSDEKLFYIESKLDLVDKALLDQRLNNIFRNIFAYSLWANRNFSKAIIHENFDISLFEPSGREFLFDANGDVKEQIKKLHLTLNNEEFQKATRIDLRIKNKIFFK